MSVSGPLPGIVLTWQLDGLSIFFGVVIVAIGATTMLYGLGHSRHQTAFPGSALLFVLFILAMLGVVVAGDAFTFLVAWESMSLVSCALVLTDHHRDSVRSAGWAYAVMSHAATACITAAFLLLARETGSLAFAEWTAHASTLDAVTASLVFALGLVGFGTKAGMIPLHVWLPRAHPVAPAPVSAVMSGVMIKLGIYGLVRLTFEWLPIGAPWWGLLILGLGAVSAVLGLLYALMQHDLKRLLAYSSVENIGIILMGLGTALVARSLDLGMVAGIALAAALFHVANHATFKALLFMGAGAIDSGVGTHELDRLGGLLRRMPLTGACFLIGSAAIAGLPPLNGFASEWLTYQSLLALGRGTAEPLIALVPLVAIGALALTAALALAGFVKAFGVAFLGMARSPHAEAAREVGALERVAMAALALSCVAIGLGAAPVVSLIGTLVPRAAFPANGLALADATPATGQLVVPALAVGVVALSVLALAAPRVLGPIRTRVVETWACGVQLHVINQYTSVAFAKPIRLMFRDIVRPVREVGVVHRAGTRFVASVHYHAYIAPIFERYVYSALTNRLVAAAHYVRRLQNGSLQTYLAYLLGALLVTLVLAR